MNSFKFHSLRWFSHLEIPHVDEAVEGTLGHDGPLADHGQAVDYRVLPAVLVTLG